MTKDEVFEEFGECIDTLDNLICALAMPIPSDLHVKSMRQSLPELKGRIKQVYFELGGEDVWSV